MVLTTPYQFPGSELDLPRHLLEVVGSFWSDTFDGNDLVASMLHSRAQLDAQAHLDLLELVASISRFNVPIFHRDNWFLLSLKESDMNDTAYNVQPYDEVNGPEYDTTGILYDAPRKTPYWCWTIPPELKDFKLLLNRITEASVTLTKGVDFFVEGDVLAFVSNPFTNDLFGKTPLFDSAGVVADRALSLWVYRGQFDYETVYKQFGYVLGLRLTSSEAYRDFLNALFDGIIEGTTVRSIAAALSALCDVALVREPVETVEMLLTDQTHKWVITDKHTYVYNLDSTVIVAVGDTVSRGQPLTDTFEILEFNRGAVPSQNQVSALSVGSGFLATGYLQDLVFRNTPTPLVVESNVAGYTKVSFDIQGFPGDVQKFWDDVHAAGVAADQTLAMLLDKRTNKVGQPAALNLPTTINPLEFLCQNIFRNNLYLVRIRTRLVGPNALGLHNGRLLRKLIPAHTAMILLTQLEVTGDEITMDGPGDERRAGYEEDVKVFLGLTIAEEMDPADYIDERVRAFQIQGRCE